MPVHELGLNLWRDNIIHSPRIQTRLLNTLLDLVHRERTGEVINCVLMRNIIKMLMDLGSSVYQQVFEKPFLEKAERCLNEEMERVSHYLDAVSESKITNVVEREMITNHMQRLVHMDNLGSVNMLVDDRYEDLGRKYNLFRRVPDGIPTLRDVMTAHTRETGKQLVTDPERLRDPVDFVLRLLDEKDKHDKIISLAFNNAHSFQNALNSSFEYFINLNPRYPEFISLFVNDKFRKGLKGVSEEDIEIVLDKVMMLFRYLQEKDVFEKYYKQHLAKRLLSGKTVSDDAERSLILSLKQNVPKLLILGTVLHWPSRSSQQGHGQLNQAPHAICQLSCLSYKEIEQGTEIPASDLKRFTSKFYKVKIGTVVAQESKPRKARDPAESGGQEAPD
ncbi:hypothetical protein NE237_006426 [Protea cynaroides]|uniref:Cullin family profile domain-containing protein n=1 Tax=Protea cynaroides TaxID=273540 RepID=A0A9Q0KMC3_9MAGN|nr:hypothetical protein NE237_006426 [Protea cynaroides]